MKKFVRSCLRLDEDAEQGAARRRFRSEVAHETIFRPDLDMSGRAIRIVNQNRAYRRLVRISHRQFCEAEVVDQFLTRLFGVNSGGARPDYSCCEERFFDVVPALAVRMGMSAFFGNAGSPHQFRIDLSINFREWLHDLFGLIAVHDINRNRFSGTIFKDEFGCGLWLGVGPQRGGGKGRCGGGEESGAADG